MKFLRNSFSAYVRPFLALVAGMALMLGVNAAFANPSALPPSGSPTPTFTDLTVSSNLTVGTINGAAYPPASTSYTLPEPLTVGDLSVSNDLTVNTINGQPYTAGSSSSSSSYTLPDPLGVTSLIATGVGTVGGEILTTTNNGQTSTRLYNGSLWTSGLATIGGNITGGGNLVINNGISSGDGTIWAGDGALPSCGPGTCSGTRGLVKAGGWIWSYGDIRAQGMLYTGNNFTSLTAFPPGYHTSRKHPNYGGSDIVSTEDIFADENIIAGNNISTGTPSDQSNSSHSEYDAGDILSTDDIFADENIIAGNNIEAGGSLTVVGPISTPDIISTGTPDAGDILSTDDFGSWATSIGPGDIAAKSDLWARGGIQVLSNIRSANGKVYTGSSGNHDFGNISATYGDGDIVSTGDVFVDDHLYVNDNAIVGGMLQIEAGGSLTVVGPISTPDIISTGTPDAGDILSTDDFGSWASSIGDGDIAAKSDVWARGNIRGLGNIISENGIINTGILNSTNYSNWASAIGAGDIAAKSDLWARGGIQVLSNVRSANGKVYTGSSGNHDFGNISATYGDGDIVSTGDVFVDDHLYVNDNAIVGGMLQVDGSAVIKGTLSDSTGPLIVNDDLQVAAATTYYNEASSKIYTGPISALNYRTHGEFGHMDIASSDDLYADDKLFVGNDITAGGDITAEGQIGNFYSLSAYANMNQSGSTVVSMKVGCLPGDVVVACSGRVENSGAVYMGAKSVSSANTCPSGSGLYTSDFNGNAFCGGPSAPGCQAYGQRGTSFSGTDLNVYAFCFSPNG